MKLHEEVYQKLKSTIINNKFYPGMRLDEKELCNMFGVSRTPIRESFQRLMQEGFINNKGPGRGFFVKRIKIEDIVSKAVLNTDSGLFEDKAIVVENGKIFDFIAPMK